MPALTNVDPRKKEELPKPPTMGARTLIAVPEIVTPVAKASII